jgi:type IV pilus biogenesis protein CpaD/CtpE
MKNRRNRIIAIVLTVIMAAAVTSCGNTTSKESEYKGIQVDSPEWVPDLNAAASADQMLVVAAFDETATDAWVSLHEKQADSTWPQER